MYNDTVSTLLALSRPTPPADRLLTYANLAERVDGIRAQLATAREQYYDLVELVARWDMRALIPKLVPAAFRVAGRAHHAAVAIRDNLGCDFADLRSDLRSTRDALAGDPATFTARAQQLTRTIERAEGVVLHLATLGKVLESALATLDGMDYVSPGFVVPKRVEQQ